MKTFLKAVLVILYIIFSFRVLFDANLKIEHFEDGSGRIVTTYCVPFTPCSD
jgi:hypothetical protein